MKHFLRLSGFWLALFITFLAPQVRAHELQVVPVVVVVRPQNEFFTVEIKGNGEDITHLTRSGYGKGN